MWQLCWPVQRIACSPDEVFCQQNFSILSRQTAVHHNPWTLPWSSGDLKHTTIWLYACILHKMSLNLLNCASFLFFAMKLFLLELASIPYSYQGPADDMFYCLCRLQPHCTWSPCLIGECCTVKGKKTSTKHYTQQKSPGFNIRYKQMPSFGILECFVYILTRATATGR